MHIALTGSIAYDYLMTFPGHFQDHILPDKLDSISLSFLVDGMIKRRGGVAPNIGYTMALLGGSPSILGTVGEDFAGYRAWLQDQGIDTRGIRVIQGEFTASFFATTDRKNAQIASFYPGAMAYAGEVKLAEFMDQPYDLVVISPNEPTAMSGYVQEAQELGIPYLYDPSQQIVRLDAEDLREGVRGAQALFVNEYEFGLIQKQTGFSPDEIREFVDLMVVTLGDRGAEITSEGETVQVPPVHPERILDPTGVGDAFRAGFLIGLSHGIAHEQAGMIGSLAATYCLEEDGPQGHHFTLVEFRERFKDHFPDSAVLDLLASFNQSNEQPRRKV
jgi:adenosine kinase